MLVGPPPPEIMDHLQLIKGCQNMKPQVLKKISRISFIHIIAFGFIILEDMKTLEIYHQVENLDLIQSDL